MITAFTCGIYAAKKPKYHEKWQLIIDDEVRILIDENGENMYIVDSTPPLTSIDLLEIAVLMNNIKRQYKQLQSNQQGQRRKRIYY